MNFLLILQAASSVVATASEPVQTEMNLWTMAKYGGPIMIILAIMFALAVYLFIERHDYHQSVIQR
jgi:hypothetical protein